VVKEETVAIEGKRRSAWRTTITEKYTLSDRGRKRAEAKSKMDIYMRSWAALAVDGTV
jgi:hypothetical protein